MATTNYASAYGIESLPAAIVFAILYFPFFVWFLSRTVARPIYVYIILTLFSAVRVTAFILRALLSRVPSDADNLNIFIAYAILYNTGFFGLLYSAYTLITDRIDLTRNPPNDPVSRILRKRFLFRIALMIAVALGITGVVEVSSDPTSSTASTLRRVAIYIFFVCVFLVFVQTFILARAELSEDGYRGPTNQIGATYGVYILLVISILLLVREAFFTATANNASQQNKEAIWYPLAVVTEFIAVALFATPGLVPDIPKDS